MRANWFSSALEKRNFRLLTTDGVLFFTAATFLDATILIPLFLENVSGSPILIGLATAIRHLGFVLPQLIIAQRMQRIHRLDRFVFWSYLICRFAMLFVIGAFLYDPSSSLVLLAFFIGYTMFAIGEGVTQVPWMDVFGRTISQQNHGKLFGLIQTLGAIGAFLGGVLIEHVLSNPQDYPYPYNFTILFGLAAVLLLISTLSFLYVRQGQRRLHAAQHSKKSWRTIFANFPRAWRLNRAFRTLLIIQLLTGVHQMAMPFYILYVSTLPGVDGGVIASLVIVQIVGGIAGGLLFGALSSKVSNTATIRTDVLLNLCVPVLILIAGMLADGSNVRYLVGAAFFLLGVVGGGWIGFNNYLMEISSDDTRGTYIAYINTCTAPLAILPIFSGSLVYVLSYPVIFMIVLILLLVACHQSWQLPATTTTLRRRGERAVRTDRQTNAAPQ